MVTSKAQYYNIAKFHNKLRLVASDFTTHVNHRSMDQSTNCWYPWPWVIVVSITCLGSAHAHVCLAWYSLMLCKHDTWHHDNRCIIRKNLLHHIVVHASTVQTQTTHACWIDLSHICTYRIKEVHDQKHSKQSITPHLLQRCGLLWKLQLTHQFTKYGNGQQARHMTFDHITHLTDYKSMFSEYSLYCTVLEMHFNNGKHIVWKHFTTT